MTLADRARRTSSEIFQRTNVKLPKDGVKRIRLCEECQRVRPAHQFRSKPTLENPRATACRECAA